MILIELLEKKEQLNHMNHDKNINHNILVSKPKYPNVFFNKCSNKRCLFNKSISFKSNVKQKMDFSTDSRVCV